MSKLRTAINMLKNDRKSIMAKIIMYFSFLFPDEIFLKLLYRFKMGRKLDLVHPKRFTEKLQWLKLNDRNPLYTELVDKEKVKHHIAHKIGEDYIIPTLGSWNKFEDIDFNKLPNQFVLKTTNGGGGSGVVICRDKIQLDFVKAKRILNRSLKQNLYKKLREWPYKYVNHRIIAEKYMQDDSGELRDYKFFCFNGEPKLLLVASNRFTDHNFNYFDMDFNVLPITSAVGKRSKDVLMKPKCFENMKEIAKRLSNGIPHVRVDLYSCNNQVFFGEMTFFDSSGYDNFSSDQWDLNIGNWIKLPAK